MYSLRISTLLITLSHACLLPCPLFFSGLGRHLLIEATTTIKTVGIFFRAVALLVIAVTFLLLHHIAKVPSELDIDAWVTPVFLMAIEGGTFREVLELTGVEHIAPVHSQSKHLIEESLAQS